MLSYQLNSATQSTHSIIFKKIGLNVDVLDVGCGPGYLGKLFKKKGARVWGIEYLDYFIIQAQPYYEEIIKGDLDVLGSLPWAKKKFDYIILADVLEHLKNPQKILRLFKPYLKDNGQMIISVPNVAHISVRINLLFGNFYYRDVGIMDKTHLKFFTLNTIKQLLKEAGLSIIETEYSSDRFSKLIKIFPFLRTLLSFQFVITAR